MKNLRVLHQSYIDLYNSDNNDVDSGLLQLNETENLCCVDNDRDTFYFYSQNNVYSLANNDNLKIFHLKNENLVNSKLIGFTFCDNTRQIYLAYSCGQLFTLDIDIPNSNSEFVAKVNEGLQTIQLSPDHEILTLITSNDTLIVMTSGFHVITEVDLNSLNFGDKQFVTVGWGKKETQFHGSEGKSAAKAKPTSLEKSECDDGLPRISWRGDGSLFAVSFLSAETNIRIFRVFNREGVLQYTSEPSQGLEDNLAWKPLGNLIATTQRFPNKHVVSFFEKNGLKHREFTLPFGPKEILVKDLQWSTDSDILSIWCLNIADQTTSVQLWTENNYHWYLKQTIPFPKDNPLLNLSWSTIAGCEKRLLVLTKEKYITYTFSLTVNHSRGKNQTDKALVGVIDGDRALLTGFKLAVVPPPMAHQALQINEPINEIVFAPEIENKDNWINSNVLFTVLHNNLLAFYKQVPQLVEYGHIKSYEIEWEIENPISKSVPYSMHHYLWYKEDTILCAAPLGSNSILCVIHIDDITPLKTGRLIVRETHTVLGSIRHIVNTPDPEIVYIVADESVLKFSKEEGVSPLDITIDESCNQMEVIEIDNKHVIISLSERYCFYIDGKEIANNITSFFVHTEFLLLTTLQHTLVCISLDEVGLKKLLTQDLTSEPFDATDNEKFLSSGLSIRRIERGSKLIISVPKDTRTILQMPRGNLECIQPRALSLYVIGTYLDDLNYHAAFDLIRKQRINLNLIYDHDPNLFVQNAEKFIQDINNPTWLSLFINDLQEEDVTSTMYSSCYSHKRIDRSIISNERNNAIDKSPQELMMKKSKIENVCEILRNLMESRTDSDRLLLPILTSLVKKHEIKDLEAALKKVKAIKKLENENESKNKSKVQSSSEEALKYLLYLIDVNTLFDISLGMYDFELVMFVASKSQKDPKEYIPFLNNLKQMEENYMRFSIDVHLKRYESALNHITKCEDRFHECISLIRAHNLYSKALKLFNVNTKQYKEIAEIYGEHLINSRKFQEAAIMFTRSNNLTKALNSFKIAGDWRESIIIAKQMKLSITDLHSLYEELVTQLKDSRKYADAAIILIQNLHKSEDAVAALCEGKLWQDALRIAYEVDRLDIIETHIKPGVIEHTDYMILKIGKNQEDFVKHKERLRVVRAEKLLKESQLVDGGDGDYEINTARGDSDLFSDTSSIAGSMTSRGSQSSRLSGKSYRSSKNRRKHERKLHSLREGSIYEDLALISTLHGIATTAYADRAEVNSLGRILLRFYNDADAEDLQNRLEGLLNLIEKSKLEIWPEHSNTNTQDLNLIGNYQISQSGQGDVPEPSLEPHLRYPPIALPSIWRLEMLSSKPKPLSNT